MPVETGLLTLLGSAVDFHVELPHGTPRLHELGRQGSVAATLHVEDGALKKRCT